MTNERSGGLNKFTLDRLKALTDGVVAIAITILVLGIEIPEDHLFTEQGLISFLHRIGHDIIIYGVSFWIIAAYWIQHHAMFHYFRYSNRTITWLNAVFLFFLTLIPFLAKFKSVYKNEPKAVLLVALGYIAVSLALLAMWRYAVSQPGIQRHHPVDAAVIRSMTLRIMVAPLISLVAIGLSFINVDVSTVCFLVIPLFYISNRLVDSRWDNGAETASSDQIE
jgi:uncharacterized membrane protein